MVETYDIGCYSVSNEYTKAKQQHKDAQRTLINKFTQTFDTYSFMKKHDTTKINFSFLIELDEENANIHRLSVRVEGV